MKLMQTVGWDDFEIYELLVFDFIVDQFELLAHVLIHIEHHFICQSNFGDK